MKIFLLFFFQVMITSVYSQICGTRTPTEVWAKKFQEIKHKQKSKKNFKVSSNYNIPVIVHVLHDGDLIGFNENISHQQIVSQIEILNRDFGATNPNVSSLPSEFSAFLAGNTGIKFCLAKQDASGNFLTEEGVDRINWNERGWRNPASILNSTNDAMNSYFNSVIKPATIWSPTEYLNIWVSTKNDFLLAAGVTMFPTFSDNTTFPEIGLTGDYIETNLTSGIWMHHTSFGTIGTASGNDGTIVTHELGHWLGLYHTFEDWDGTQTCGGITLATCDDGGDYCCDTPPQQGPSNDCSLTRNTCGTLSTETDYHDMTMNYMNYGGCKYMFTGNQVERMYATMDNGIYRSGLSASNGCELPKADLIITNQSTTSTTVTAGNFVLLYFGEYNEGYTAVNPHYISLHLSADRVLTPDNNGDFYVGEYFYDQTLPPLYPTTQLTKQVLIPANTPPGHYYLFFSADGSEIIDESNEENNFATVQIDVTASAGCSAPLLTVPVSRTVIAPSGTNFSVTASGSGNNYQWQLNTGTGWVNLSNGTPYSGVYSTTLAISSTNSNMSGYRYRCTASNSCGNANSESATLMVNTSSTSCNNDFACSPKVININTACIVTSCTTVGATPPSPGVTFLGCSNIFYQTGRYDDDVWFSITPTNTSPVTVKVTPTSNPTNFDPVLGIYTGACLSLSQIPGGCSDNPIGSGEQITFTPIAGNTYLLRVFSYGMTSSTQGNFDICATSAGSSGSAPMPDLEAGNVSFTTTSICPGGSFQVNFDVENNGDASAGSSTVKYYLSSNSTYSGDDVLLGSSSVTGIGINNNVSKTKALSVPAGTSNGNWNVLIIVDGDNNVNEGSDGEDNNVYAKNISVSTCSLADIQLTYTGTPPNTGNIGVNIPVSFECTNIGGSITPPTRVGFYLSTDNIFDPQTDIYLDDEATNSLDPNEIDADNSGINISNCLPCGTYFIIMVADYQNLVSESNRNNNIYVFPYTLTGCVTCTVSIPSTQMNFQSAGGTGNIPVTAYQCCAWAASTNDNWITITNANGTGNGYVNYSIASCSGGSTRTGSITVAGQSFPISQNCTETCNSSNSFVWAAQAGSATLSDAAVDLAKDADGNLFMTGDIQGSANFGNGIILTTPTTAPDIFVSKHNSSGNIQWAKQFSSSGQEEGTGIASDKLGFIYVIGYVTTSVTFGSTTISNNGTDNDAAFLLKLNSSGNVMWAQKINSTNYARPTAIALDNDNGIFITGNYSAGGSGGLFIAKYNTDGSQDWYSIYGLGSSLKLAFGIAKDNTGNILICGRYMSTLTLGSITLSAVNSPLDTDGFVAKADGNGNIIWARKITSPGQGTDELRAVTTDLENNIYVAGNIDSNAIVDGITIPLSPSSKTIIIKYDQNGNVVWVKASTEGYQYNYNKVITINANEIYVTGNYSGSMRIDSTVVTSAGSNDNYLARIDENGKVVWLKSYGGTDYEQCGGLIFDDSKSLYVSGAFSGSINFGNSTITSAGSSDIYIAKFKQCDPPAANISYIGSPTVCPGQTISLSTSYCSSHTYQWLLNDIDIVGANDANYTAIQTGAYKVRVTASHACETLSAPLVLSSQTIYTFTGTGDWSDASNWSNGIKPPSTLPSCAEIIIQPQAGGECRLNVPQTISEGGKITVITGSSFIVMGNLIIQN